MFCVVKNRESLGLAKIIDATGANWTVEYFDSPTNTKMEILSVPKGSIITKKLGSNTRIYFRHEITNRWQVGRVLEDMGDKILARFSGKNDMLLDYDNIYVRYNKPISDPVDFLAHVITETPQYAESRSGFLESYISQRGVAWGISALLSSVIELEPHQINVVRRILSDPSQRYLLADEVGLGKTIEAGVVIRQTVLDDPRQNSIVVLVPKTLVQQWRQELIVKFGLIDFLDVSVFVLAQNSLDEIRQRLPGVTLLVIDEAHHVTAGDDDASIKLYDLVKNYSKSIERLLLLSATPVLRNERGFLRMLHLLDDVIYDLEDEKGFRAKVNHRQVLAEAVASLDPQNVLYLDSVLDELAEKLPDDARLHELILVLKSELVRLPEEDDPDLIESIRILRAHLSETYRLNRRILRNRRKQVVGVTPNRSGVSEILVKGTNSGKIETLIEDWRIGASSQESTQHNNVLTSKKADYYWRLINALLTAPSAIKSICYGRLTDIQSSPMNTFPGEILLLQEIHKSVDRQQWLESRMDRLTLELPNLLEGLNKVIVFCTQPETANSVFHWLNGPFKDSVVRHAVSEEGEEGEDEDLPWLKFNSSSSTKIIVCDRDAEEGINLQGGHKIVIHFDLPLEPNRIEQRMGRVDRYGSGEAIQSIVLLDDDSRYQSNWFKVLNNSLDIFGRSISSLQYLIDAQIQQLKIEMFLEGVEAVEKLEMILGGVSGLVSKELKLIDQQDGLDELSQLSENELDFLFDIDSEWKGIRNATLNWACNTLLFGQFTEHSQGTSLSVDTPFRFQYKAPDQGVPATLISLSGFINNFLGALDYDYRRSTSKQPLSYPYLSKRQSAVVRGTRLLRYGDNFIEALKSFTESDDRGRSYAMWRQFYEGFNDSNVGMYFRFDFLIETNLEEAKSAILDSNIKFTDTTQAAIARRGDALFAPQVVQIWINEEGDEPSEEFIETYLLPTYDKVGENKSYIDTNLKSSRFRSLMDCTPDTFLNWEIRCIRMRDRAKEVLNSRTDLFDSKKTAIERARIEDEIRVAQLSTRIRLLEGVEAQSEHEQLTTEMSFNEALYKGIQEPSIKVDVAGMVILSNVQFQIIE